jgi:hypothetical protein
MALQISKQPATMLSTTKRKEPLTSSSSGNFPKRPMINKVQTSHQSRPSAPSFTSSQKDPRRQETDEFHNAILQMSLKTESRCPSRARSPPIYASKSDSKGDGGRAAGVTEEPRALPVRFGSHEEYVSVMSPLVLEEIRAEVRGTLLF